MKIVFAALMCLVLATSEAFAVSGGPVFPAGANLVGTYAGILQPAFDPTDPFSSNSIGIFTASVPATGFAGGDFVFFTQGRIFLGTMQGIGDPKGATIKGILQADTGGAPTVATDSLPSARGKLDAKVIPNANGTSLSTAVRVTGKATLLVSEGNTDATGKLIISSAFTLLVRGFKQSNTATPVAVPTT